MEGTYFEKVNTSRNALKLKKKLEGLGHTNVEVWYEPVRGGCEMCGYDGGVFFHSDQSELEPVGYSYEEASEYIDECSFYDFREKEEISNGNV